MYQMHLARVSMAHVVVLLLLLVAHTVGYPQYQANIPNGQNVPDPCQPANAVWSGVGHQSPMGGGPRNPFGTDFGLNNYNWAAVCRLDSDGDGQTNGQELCDPQCTWRVGDPDPTGCQLSHPGVCEPLYASDCRTRNAWLTCPGPFNCSAIHQPGVQSITLRIPPTPIPPRVTTYLCHGFLLPNDSIDYHVIAITPVIKTSAVLHHMVMFVCKDPPEDQTMFNTSVECGMTAPGCNQLIGLWSIGLSGQCVPNAYGFRIGPGGYKYAVIQLHWNNPRLVSTFVDSSGMTLYYTPHLRPNDGAVLVVGQASFAIPPGQSSFAVSGKCPAVCSSALPRPLNIAGAVIHMHLLGRAGNIGMYRDNVKTAELVSTDSYDYNSPKLINFDEPFVFLPGDEIRVNCVYQSLDRNTTTVYGMATSDEMCFGFLPYYPAQDDFMYCLQYGAVPGCTNNFVRCDLVQFNTLHSVIRQYCNLTNCTAGCRGMVQAYHDSNCMVGDIGLYIRAFWPGVGEIYDAVAGCGLPPCACRPPTPEKKTAAERRAANVAKQQTRRVGRKIEP